MIYTLELLFHFQLYFWFLRIFYQVFISDLGRGKPVIICSIHTFTYYFSKLIDSSQLER